MSSRTALSERYQVQLSTVYEVCRVLGASLDIARTFRVALNTLASQLGLQRAMVVMPAEDGGNLLRIHSWVGLDREQAARGHWRSGEGVIGRVYASGMAAVVPDVQESPEFLDRTGAFGARGDRPLAFVVVPMKTERATVGVLAAQRVMDDGARLTDDQRLLTMVATLLAQSAALHVAVAEEHSRLLQETTRLQKALAREPRGRLAIDNVIGESRAMQQVFTEVHQAAPSRATVLLRGESGTGKEAIARAIHFLSPRKDAPFIKVNCAALTESLLESELFGHERGAFTGAVGERKGRFELAHGGTLFLDEIGDISPGFQAKLLRVLQEREFERVGGSKAVKVDVRLICATNRDLEKMVQRGEYRADLYYRINVVSIFLPPLRERRSDIPPLVNHFIERFNQENRRQLKVTPEAMKVLTSCYWPGNVRELENCIERTATMVQGDLIRDLAFPCRNNRCLTQTLHFLDKADAVAAAAAGNGFNGHVLAPTNGHAAPPAAADGGWSVPAPAPAPPLGDLDAGAPAPAADGVTRIGPTQQLPPPVSRLAGTAPDGERERLIWAMEQCGWVQAKAARLLRITPRQLGYALQKHRIEVRKL
ncbi:nif-specific transcriptional activator NifA [Rubrivivax gelatinosus]|uniref:Nif-specific regulatory protein n=1 Tax=Rubrivivax gelatinosus (strain NBRC 100245 / IL144) TaxID=983917 RepID=I0HXB6_RUBGI|nr:nif-specific transcriptional activator NifA [Rubrivivax gelatinosus]BAL97653.1 nitrogen fixation specific regulatory protein NifA [Rubrivivax gelatinosus IL144]